MGQRFTEMLLPTLQIKPLTLAGTFWCLDRLLQ